MITISNTFLKAEINPLGAELHSLSSKTGENLIWSRDPAYWPKSAPILFPIVGVMKNDHYTFRGKRYPMPKHGLVRTQEWEVHEQGPTHASFRIHSDEESIKSYPFQWELLTHYFLEENSIKVKYELSNKGVEAMFFSLGSHPAIALNFGKDEIEDYFVRVFRKNGPLKRRIITQDGLLDTEETIGDNNEEDHVDIPITQNLFEQDALVFTNAHIETLEIRSYSTPKSILFHTGGTPDLGIWSKPGAAYVCIEPWFGYDDPSSHTGEIEKKPGIQHLNPNDKFETSYTIESKAFLQN